MTINGKFSKAIAANPAGDLFAELEEQDILAGVNGGCDWYNLSCRLGNKGAYCTLTIECMPSCNSLVEQ